MGAKSNDSHSEKQAIVKFYTLEYRKCGNFNSKNDSRPCMGASAFLESVDFTAFAENVKTVAPTQKLYQSGHAIWWGEAPHIVYSLVENVNLKGKTIIPFSTSISSGLGSSGKHLKARANISSKTKWLKGRNFYDVPSQKTVNKWVGKLKY